MLKAAGNRLLWLAVFLLVPTLAQGEAVTPHRWALIPRVDLSATYDDNVYRTGNRERDDFFVEPELSLDYRSSTETNRWMLRGSGFYAHRFYAQEDSLDFEAFGEELKLRYQGDGPGRWEVIQGFRRMEDVDRHVPESDFIRLTSVQLQDINSMSARRDILDGGAAYAHEFTDKSEGSLTYRYSSVGYDDSNLLDLDAHLLQAETAYLISEKSVLYADLGYSRQEQNQGGGSADLALGHLGARTRHSEKLVGKFGLGFQYYDRSTTAGAKNEQGLSVDTSFDWLASEKVTLHGGLNNGHQLSSFYENNGLAYVNTWAGLTYRWTEQIQLWLRGLYRRDSYIDDVASGDLLREREDERYEMSARLNYRANSTRWEAYVQASHEIVESTLPEYEYDDTRLTLGTQVAY